MDSLVPNSGPRPSTFIPVAELMSCSTCDRLELFALQAVALRLREDVASEVIDREANMRNAPAREAGLFLVPKVIE